MSEALMHFASSLYDLEAVREVSKLFAEVAPLSVRAEGDEIIVEIGDYKGDLDLLRDEFRNRALYETVLRDADGSPEVC